MGDGMGHNFMKDRMHGEIEAGCKMNERGAR